MGESRQAANVLAAIIAAIGVAAIFAFSSRRVSGWLWGLAWVLLAVGLLIPLVQTIPPLERAVTAPWRNYKLRRLERQSRDARYRQRLRCSSCGHEFEETVRATPLGWLEYEGAVRTCPSCGNATESFTSLGAVPLNKEAERLKAIPSPSES
jgi:rubredoxin